MTTVLVVDDDVDFTALTAKRLGQEGYAVHTAASCQEAFERAKQAKPDIVLLDVMLGDGLGYGVCRAFRKDPELYRIPVVFQSVLKDKREVQYAVEQGGDAYLTKPYTEQILLSKMALMTKLVADTDQRDQLTGLPSYARMRREVEHRLLREEDFALCYAWLEEPSNSKAVRLSTDAEEAIKLVADILRRVVRDCAFHETHLCHVTGLHFLALVPIDERKRFRECVLAAFRDRIQFRSPGKQEAEDPLRGLSLLVVYTHTRHKTYTHAASMFQDLRAFSDKRERKAQREAKRANRRIGHDHWVDF